MITDENVRQLFQGKLDTPDGYMNPKRAGRGGTQIFRGMPSTYWKDIPYGGCIRFQRMFENNLGIIPKYCFDCFKVEILPRTVVELFKLLMVFERISLPHDYTRKCMVEGRPDASGTYKGFVYVFDLEEGRELREIVRRAIADDISPKVPVTLKRGCSEFAKAYPEYMRVEPGVQMMEYSRHWQAKEDQYWQSIDEKEKQYWQSYNKEIEKQAGIQFAHTDGVYPPHEIYAMQGWLVYAATIGDISYQVISGKALAPAPGLKRPAFLPPAD